ncbi:hypothetical protein CDAR_85381 [Caerostris darwini]|uniref:Uncharacterized protein n=1 Tax=Caerostris darwini TaxID=1538125 RepID=A0AAV4UHL4_9ARAC|nr:hypothetical protein CDAR_85381 [Caerostris darwini]
MNIVLTHFSIIPHRALLSTLCKHRNRHKWLKWVLKWKRPLIRMFVGHFCRPRIILPATREAGNCIQITVYDIVSDEMNYRFLHRGLWNNASIGCRSSAPLFAQL